MGGLRGFGTRLTLLLALLGGSLATAAGKHITIDLITRYLRPRARLPTAVAGWIVTTFVCLTAAWGFFDHISIEGFGARADASVSEKLGGEEWNRFLDESGFVERYSKEKVGPLRISADAKRAPMVVVPGEGEPRGDLTRVANLVFPLGDAGKGDAGTSPPR